MIDSEEEDNMKKEEMLNELMQWIWDNEHRLDLVGLTESINELLIKFKKEG